MREPLIILLLCSILAAAVPVQAQPLAPGARPVTLQERLLLREQWVRAKERERAQIRLGGPITGVVLGSLLLGASFAVLSAGSDRGELATSVTMPMLLIALPITIASSVILGKRVRARRAITREIWAPAGLASGGLRWTF